MTIRPLRSQGVEVIGWRDYPTLLIPTLRMQATYVFGVVRHAVTRAQCHNSAPTHSPVLVAPESPLVEAAHKTAVRELSDERWLLHSLRTWAFAKALAAHDHHPVDDELLYVACLLHDVGLFHSARTGCFAIESARAACTIGASGTETQQLVSAIESHIAITPNNQLGRYLRAGSLLDVIGMRAWDLDRDYMKRTCERWPRTGFDRDLRQRWREESRRVPLGRAAFARWPGGLTLASHGARLLISTA